MKNLLRISLVLVVLLLVTTTVNAMTESEFIDHVTAYQEIAGKSVKLVQEATVKRILKANNLSDEDLDVVAEKFDDAVKVLKKADTLNYKELTNTERDELINLANAVKERTGIGYEINSDGTVKIINTNGTTDEIDLKVAEQTGSSNYIYLVPIIAIVAVAMVIVSKRALSNAR